MRSDLSGFHRLSPSERLETVAKLAELEPAVRDAIGHEGLDLEAADLMVENVLGLMGLPFAVCTNMVIDGEDRLIPMVIEEPSVVAAASHAAKLLRAGGGVVTTVTEPLMVGQIQLLDVPDLDAAEAAIKRAMPELLELANSKHNRLRAAGGGARDIEIRHLAPLGDDDPVGHMMVLHLVVDVRDAMGANAINSMCERLAPVVSELTGGRVRLRILSNLSDRRLVTVRGRVPWSALEGKGGNSPEELALGIQEASVFAERDPYRAATHNKGIMNGIDAAAVALGQDWRAIEAGAHAYAARDGRYTALATWRARDGYLEGTMTIPMAVGTVGGVVKVHPTMKAGIEIAAPKDAADLGRLIAAVGLAQNLGALRALSAEGIQSGHMRLHARNVAVTAGATGDEVQLVADRIAAAGTVRVDAATDVLAQIRA